MMIYKRFDVERKTINFLQPLFFYSHLDYKWIRFSVFIVFEVFFLEEKKETQKLL